ncbi:putative TIR domain, P-loop containing nucleoside triphosphate hydrolase [Arabidopsis thaliana]
MSLMDFPSSIPSCNYRFNVFSSFHGPDVRKTLLSHMRKQFNFNGITMFDDQGIERSEEIVPSLKKAIKESRISIVILSKKYALSRWCLDELVEILKCKEVMGHRVMTIFYGVEPSDVRKQTGEFGFHFNETCAHRTNEDKQNWSKALKDVGNIAGEDFLRWDNEAKMIEKIARDVSYKLNATPYRDFDGMVGLQSHLREMESLLDLDYDGVKMVAISGAAGIGKTTIARALQSRLSNKFQLTCFVDNLKESFLNGLDELRLQEQFLAKVLNHDGIRICHSGVIEERLCKQRVLIILDDVNHIMQLEAIVVTTENKELLLQHGIKDLYHVGFPSDEQAIEILCRYAFRKITLYHGFEKLARRVTKLCSNLPLGLRVLGSSLRGKNEEEWEEVIRRLETILDHQDIEEVLRVGYGSLHENEQSLFLHIAVFFNYTDGDLVKAMFTDNNLDIKHGLKILADKSLINISNHGEIVIHKLLQQFGRQAVHKEEPWKRKILIHAPEICDVLEHATGTRAMSGISFDISGIDEVVISGKSFKRMPNLRFLKVFKSRDDGNDRVHIPEETEFPRRLRLLHWEAYPCKSLPPTFQPQYLVELYMPSSQLEKLWEGTQRLTHLKKMNLFASRHLKELPDLSHATNLERLDLSYCESLVEIPSSFSHLHKLEWLEMNNCINLQVIPAHMNLASLETVNTRGCSRLRNIPVMSTNITQLYVSRTAVEEMPPSIRFCSRLERLSVSSSGKLKGITHLPISLKQLDLFDSDIETISECIKSLHLLYILNLSGCRRLASLPELPSSLRFLMADDCESLETVFCPLNTPKAELNFTNCFKLGQQAQRAIVQRSLLLGTTLLPGREVSAEFDHRGKGNTLTIRPSTGFVVCVVISPNLASQVTEYRLPQLLCRRRIGQGDLDPIEKMFNVRTLLNFQTEHLFVFIIHPHLPFIDPSEVSREIVFEFSSKFNHFDVIDCGAKILADGSIKGSYESGLEQVFEDNTKHGEHADCWSWLFHCFDLSHFVKNVRSFVSG